MTLAPLHRRLMALETALPKGSGREDLTPYGRLVLILVAHHLGEMTPDESVGVGLARALGYTCPSAFRGRLNDEADATGGLEFDRRYADAVGRLLALRGTSFADAGNGVARALKTLFLAMPEALKRHPFLDGVEAERIFADLHDEPVADRVFARGVEPDGNCSMTATIGAHLYQASCYRPFDVPHGKSVLQAAADYEQERRRG